MKKIVFLLPLLIIGMGVAYAEPFENIHTTVLDFSNNTASVQISWDADASVSFYHIGCVSCFPNTVNSTSENSIIVNDVTTFPNSTIAMLYGIAFDVENQIMTAKQIIVNLVQ